MTYDLLIKGGIVVDPSQGLHAVRDVALADGKVAAVAEGISDSLAAEVLDANGLVVTPGLIDLHVHAFWGGSHYGIEPDTTMLAKGVTTAVDAGSSGACTFRAFRRYVLERAEIRLYALLNISAMGMVCPRIGELEDIRWANVEDAVAEGRRNPQYVLGIKARLGRAQAAENDIEALKRAVEAAEALGGFVMIHIANTKSPLGTLTRMLRSGDVITHSFHGVEDGILAQSGEGLDALKEAQERGVVVDVGHGGGGFSFPAAEKALGHGLAPGNISSDLHISSVEGPVFDLLTTLSKFMYLGLSLDEVIRLSTATTAKVMGLQGKLGTLKVGAEGDVAILKLEEGRFIFRDRHSTKDKMGSLRWEHGVTVEAKQRLSHVRTVKGGKIYRPWLR